MNELHEANRRGWDAVSPGWQRSIDETRDWRNYPLNPSMAFSPQELPFLEDLSGKDACVLGSGDNLVVFALAGMGARVTSVDISQTQLNIASGRAVELGLDVTFIRADVSDLAGIADESFDIVYTGGHVAVWVSDLEKYYLEAGRILRPNGLSIVHEYHPFRRIWTENSSKLEMEFGYFDRGPHHYDRSEDVPGMEPGSLPNYEFHWTVSDFVTAFLNAGCHLIRLDELGDGAQDWETAPLAGLPANLLLIGRKA